MKLDFGCGENLKQGFDGVDIRPLEQVKYHCPAWQMRDRVEHGSVEEIYSCHLLQYLSVPQAFTTLQTFHMLLKEGGVIQIIVPDFSYWSEKIKTAQPGDSSVTGGSTLQESIWNLWGRQREGMDQMWDVAKSGYTFGLLSAMLLKNGFQSVFRLNDEKPWDLNILAQKRGAKEQKEQEEHLKALEKHQNSCN